MRTSKLNHAELIERIAVVFRQQGYAGASLSALSEATGLERASLYHRFPGGKDQMAEAVLTHIARQLETELFAPLRLPGKIAAKIDLAIEVIKRFYKNGHLPCILESMSLAGATSAVRKSLASAANAFIEALAGLARELGVKSEPRARECAASFLASIEGALILSRATGDASYFESAISQLPDMLAAK